MISFLAAFCAGIAGFCVAFFVLKAVFSIEIERVSGTERQSLKLPVMFRLLMPLLPNARKFAVNEMFLVQREKDEKSLMMAGLTDFFNGVDFVGLRIMFAVAGFVFMVVLALNGYILYGIIVQLLLFIYPGAWLKSKINRRHWEITRALPNVLDLLTLSVEAGKDFISSLRDILLRRKRDALSEELSRCFQEIQLGRKRTDALRDMVNRVQQPDLTSAINAIIQAEELGVSIGQILRIQGDMLRNKRFNRAEKLANEAPVKIIFPVIVFIFPALLLILAVPIFISAMKVFA